MGTDQMRTAATGHLDPWEAKRLVTRLAQHFEEDSELSEQGFDQALTVALTGTDRDEAEIAESDEVQVTELKMAEAVTDPHWEAVDKAHRKWGIEHGGEDDPRPKCDGGLMIDGKNYRCHGAGDHYGWSHWNPDAAAIWR
jgi:hypothetical protein